MAVGGRLIWTPAVATRACARTILRTVPLSKERRDLSIAEITEITEIRVNSTESERTTWFEQDVVALRPKLYQHALRITHNHNDAEDLVQETLTKAYGALDRFRSGTNFAGWLHRIMINSYINGYRKR